MILPTRWIQWALILPLVVAAPSAADAGNIVSIFKVKGNTALALFDAFDPADPCLESFVSVAAADFLEKVMPNGRTTSFRTTIAVIDFDVCTETVLFNGEGVTESHTFEVTPDLKTATLSAEVTVQHALTTLNYPFQVSMTWKATGKPQTTNSNDKFRDPVLGVKITDKSHSTIVDATATGTVFGNGRNHTPLPSDSGNIGRENDGTHVVERAQ
jgi:hypothetical protein